MVRPVCWEDPALWADGVAVLSTCPIRARREPDLDWMCDPLSQFREVNAAVSGFGGGGHSGSVRPSDCHKMYQRVSWITRGEIKKNSQASAAIQIGP